MDVPASSPILLQAKNVYKSFVMGTQTVEVLKGIDLDIYRGEMLAMIGASGAGKSTFLHIMGTLDQPTRGDILYDGQNIFKLTEQALATFRNQRLGFVFQFHHLLPEFTALENTYLPALIQNQPKRQAMDEATTLLAEVGLAHRLHHKPGELSGGEQQRVAVARALIQSPDIVFGDEPTGNLDTKTGEMLFELLQTLNQKRHTAFVIVTHNEHLSERVDRLIHMQDGKILRDS